VITIVGYWRPLQTLPYLTNLRHWRPNEGHELVNAFFSDFDKRVRSESGDVSFAFQSFPDCSESAARRMPDTVHPLSGKHVEFDHDGYVGSECVNRSSCPPTVSMSGDVDRVHAVDVEHPHSAPVRWMKVMADKLDVSWNAFNRNRV